MTFVGFKDLEQHKRAQQRCQAYQKRWCSGPIPDLLFQKHWGWGANCLGFNVSEVILRVNYSTWYLLKVWGNGPFKDSNIKWKIEKCKVRVRETAQLAGTEGAAQAGRPEFTSPGPTYKAGHRGTRLHLFLTSLQ